jgi:hypothetical protein
LDRKRLDRCIESVFKREDGENYYSEEEEAALWEQQRLHAETLPYPENVEYLQQCAEEARQKAQRSFVHAFLLGLATRTMEAHLIKGKDTTLGDVIDHLGIDGYVDAVAAQLRSEGYGDPITIQSPDDVDVDGNYKAIVPLATVLDYFRREAKQLKNKEDRDAA